MAYLLGFCMIVLMEMTFYSFIESLMKMIILLILHIIASPPLILAFLFYGRLVTNSKSLKVQDGASAGVANSDRLQPCVVPEVW